MPQPPAALVWSILAAALLGVFLAIPSRKSRAGKRAIICGGINATIWCIVMLAVNVIPGHSRSPNGSNDAWSSAPSREEVVSDAFDLDTGTSCDSSGATRGNSLTDAAFPRWDWLISSNGVGERRAVKDGLVGYAAIAHLGRIGDWGNITFQELTNRLQFSVLTPFAFLNEVDAYGFRTREGSVGILKLTGRSKSPPGVKIRYKLVPKAPSLFLKLGERQIRAFADVPVSMQTIVRATDPSSNLEGTRSGSKQPKYCWTTKK